MSIARTVFRESRRAFSKACYAGYTIYKDEGALTISVAPPSIRDNGRYKSVVRKGVLQLDLAKRIEEPGDNRRFDFKNKVTMNLSVGQCGELISPFTLPLEFNTNRLDKGKAIFKNYSMILDRKDETQDVYVTLHERDLGPENQSEEPTNTKSDQRSSQSEEPTNTNSAQKSREVVSVPLTLAELAILRSLVSYSIPHLVGFDKVLQSERIEVDNQYRNDQSVAKPSFQSRSSGSLPDASLWGSHE
ncbi:hypothetical protein AAMO2058_000744300 [Amorphochlora amoebiformis]